MGQVEAARAEAAAAADGQRTATERADMEARRAATADDKAASLTTKAEALTAEVATLQARVTEVDRARAAAESAQSAAAQAEAAAVARVAGMEAEAAELRQKLEQSMAAVDEQQRLVTAEVGGLGVCVCVCVCVCVYGCVASVSTVADVVCRSCVGRVSVKHRLLGQPSWRAKWWSCVERS